MADEVIATYPRGKGEVKAIATVYRGEDRVDIRYWYLDPKTQMLKPGRQGISLTFDEFELFNKLVKDIELYLYHGKEEPGDVDEDPSIGRVPNE